MARSFRKIPLLSALILSVACSSPYNPDKLRHFALPNQVAKITIPASYEFTNIGDLRQMVLDQRYDEQSFRFLKHLTNEMGDVSNNVNTFLSDNERIPSVLITTDTPYELITDRRVKYTTRRWEMMLESFSKDYPVRFNRMEATTLQENTLTIAKFRYRLTYPNQVVYSCQYYISDPQTEKTLLVFLIGEADEDLEELMNLVQFE